MPTVTAEIDKEVTLEVPNIAAVIAEAVQSM